MRRFLPFAITPAYHLWMRTLRVRFFGYNAFSDPVIYLFWHNRLFPLIFTHRGRGVTVMVSTHRDGELVARLLDLHGFGLARGSATRGGARAVREMMRALKKGLSLAITPDGPRGPRYQFKEGAWRLVSSLKAPVLYVGLAYSSFWELSSWDRFRLPKPFCRCAVYLEEERDRDISPREAGERLRAANRKAEDILASWE